MSSRLLLWFGLIPASTEKDSPQQHTHTHNEENEISHLLIHLVVCNYWTVLRQQAGAGNSIPSVLCLWQRPDYLSWYCCFPGSVLPWIWHQWAETRTLMWKAVTLTAGQDIHSASWFLYKSFPKLGTCVLFLFEVKGCADGYNISSIKTFCHCLEAVCFHI